jgi:hypothetical protein
VASSTVRPADARGFSPPTEPFVSDEATLLLYHFEGNTEGAVKDNSKLGQPHH